jgi:hypothetical protein
MLNGTRQRLLVYHVVMASRKPKSNDKKPVDYSKLFIAGKTSGPVESFGAPGKSYPVPSNAVKTTNVDLRGADKGVFRGGSTPLGTSLGLTKTNTGAVVSAALIATSLPARAGSVPVIAAAKVTNKLLGRYAVPAVRGAAQGAFSAATKGLEKISEGGRIYQANTVFGPTLASTKFASVAQTEARLTGLEANAARIATQSARGASAGGVNIVKDVNKAKKVLKGAALLGGVYGVRKK